MFKIKNLFFLTVFIVGCDPSSNTQKKDIDLSGIGSATESSANSPKTQDSQVGGYAMANTNQNPRTGKAFPR